VKYLQGLQSMQVYTAADIKQIYKLTQKQRDDLDKSHVIKPSIRPAQGKGSQRLYSFEDLLAFRFIKQLLDARWSMKTIKTAIQNLRTVLPDKDPLQDFVLLSINGSIIARCAIEHGQPVLIDALTQGQLVMPIILSEIREKAIEDVQLLYPSQTYA
jgi:DNA-binding transcriptional MerR regulator